MGIFNNIFKDKKKVALNNYFHGFAAYQPAFTTFNGGIYEAEITRAAIHAFATHASKLVPEVKGANNDVLRERLRTKPNPWQTTSQWLYRTATILSVENNAFILPILEYTTNPEPTITGYYTVSPSRCEVMDYAGEAWLRYRFATGEIGAIELRRCAILTNFQNKDDFFGDSNAPLLPTLQLIYTQNEGIQEGIKSSAAVRFVGKLGSVLQKSDIDAERKRFREDNFAADNNGGIVLIDGKYSELIQINSKPYIVDAEQINAIKNNVFNYFGVNESILRNEWDEKTHTAFYEGKIEPFAIQLGLGLTCMTFSERARTFGNKIELNSNRLQYATTQTKMNVIMNGLDRGVINRNEAREMLQLPPIDGGDAFVIRGEYVSTDQKITEGTINANKE